MSRPSKNRATSPIRYAILVFIILSLAAFLRIYKLGSIPYGIYCDEAANGYDSFCILKTGADMHGRTLPFIIKHHDIDFIESLYVYLSVPFIALFNLSIFSTRFLAAFIGTLTVLSVFFLTRELFGKNTALIAALLIALSPWHLHFSRIAFRAILAPFFITTGLYFFFRGLRKPVFLVSSAVFFGLALNSYTAAKISVPLMLAVLFILYRRKIAFQLAHNKTFARCAVFSTFILFFLALASYFPLLIYKNPHIGGISIFSTEENPLFFFIRNFGKHLSPGFLFISGDTNLRHSIPGFGQYLHITAIFLASGIIYAFKFRKKNLILLVSFFLAGLVPSALTNDFVPHALRAITSVPFLEILASYGAVRLYGFLLNKKFIYKTFAAALISFLFLFDAAYFVHDYFLRYPLASRDFFQGPSMDALNYAKTLSSNYEYIVLSDKLVYPYILPLFFDKINPNPRLRKNKIKYIISMKNVDDTYRVFKGKALFIVKADELPGEEPIYCILNRNNRFVLKVLGTVPN